MQSVFDKTYVVLSMGRTHAHTHTHTHKLVVSGSLGNFGSKFIDKRARNSFDLVVLFWILVYIHNTDILAG